MLFLRTSGEVRPEQKRQQHSGTQKRNGEFAAMRRFTCPRSTGIKPPEQEHRDQPGCYGDGDLKRITSACFQSIRHGEILACVVSLSSWPIGVGDRLRMA